LFELLLGRMDKTSTENRKWNESSSSWFGGIQATDGPSVPRMRGPIVIRPNAQPLCFNWCNLRKSVVNLFFLPP
jgi:hypothetical protein